MNRIGVATALALTALGCSHPVAPEVCEAPQPTPDPDWPESTPEAQGFDATMLQAAADYAETNRSLCLLVVRHGTILGEWYWQGATRDTPIRTWSLAKSYTSTLVGFAIADGLIHSVDDAVSKYVPEWRDAHHSTIKIRDLLSMTSGLTFDQTADSVTFFQSADMTGQALALTVSDPPGTVWRYSNQAVQVFEAVMRNATGKSADVYAREKLWGPINMSSATWFKDAAGHPSMYMNVLATCRDNARFGELLLRKGCWGKKRVIGSKWIKEATASSTTLDKGYGWLWWLNAGAPTLDSVSFQPLATGSYHPFAPADAFCASGLGNQMIEVIPSLDMVVVRTGFAPQEDPALLNDPLGEINATLNDGKAIIHSGVLQRVLAAIK